MLNDETIVGSMLVEIGDNNACLRTTRGCCYRLLMPHRLCATASLQRCRSETRFLLFLWVGALFVPRRLSEVSLLVFQPIATVTFRVHCPRTCQENSMHYFRDDPDLGTTTGVVFNINDGPVYIWEVQGEPS